MVQLVARFHARAARQPHAHPGQPRRSPPLPRASCSPLSRALASDPVAMRLRDSPPHLQPRTMHPQPPADWALLQPRERCSLSHSRRPLARLRLRRQSGAGTRGTRHRCGRGSPCGRAGGRAGMSTDVDVGTRLGVGAGMGLAWRTASELLAACPLEAARRALQRHSDVRKRRCCCFPASIAQSFSCSMQISCSVGQPKAARR